jgi:hypothetical protein
LVLNAASIQALAGLVYMHVALGLTQPFWLAMNIVLGVIAIGFAVWLSRRLSGETALWRRGLAAVALPAVLMLVSMWAFLSAAPGSGLRLVSTPGTYFGTSFFFVPFVFIAAYVLGSLGRRSGPAATP